MNILSLYTGLCASSSVFNGARVVAATHEERFTRRKNDEAFPRQAIDYCLNAAGIKPDDLEGVAIASQLSPSDNTRCHAAYSYYASPFRSEKVLARTVGGMGDDLNATISVFDENGHYQRH
jgi:predicted NodU family carbamoyl transferase